MSSGLQVLNDSGTLQIDETYRRLLRVASGTVTTGSSMAGGSVTFPTQNSCTPLIFYRPSADGVYVGPLAVTPGGFDYFSSGAFDYVVYGLDSPLITDGSSMGTQIFNSSGAVIYDSRYEGLRIQTSYTVTMPWPDYFMTGPAGGAAAEPHYPYTNTFTGWGAKPWICLNSLLYWADQNGTCIAGTTSGFNAIKIDCGTIYPDRVWLSYGGDRISSRSYPYGTLCMPIARRDF